jgi:tRNA(Arg) A34 adenosine deaminase TadA
MLEKFFEKSDDRTRYNRGIFNDLITIAQDILGDGNAKVAAAVVYRHRNILSVGHNNRQSHPFQQRYGKNKDSIYWHAETHAIYNALRREPISTIEKCSLYVVRVKRPYPRTKTWIPGFVRPCPGCQGCIRAHGITDVYYTTNDKIAHENFFCD